MKNRVLNRTIAAVGITAVALIGMGRTLGAQSPSPPDQQQDQKQQKAKPAQGNSQNAPGQQKQPPGQQKRLTQQEQQARIQQQEQRTVQYRQHLDEQQRVAQQQRTQLQQQNRRAQVTFQQQYVAGLQQQQVRLQSQNHYNYGADPYFYTPSTYRYAREGRYYETNQYGADLLRQAVNAGYDQGIRAGQADRQDRWASNYQNSYAYQDANYGYGGFYVDRADYNNYFREGFRRGYADGYNGRYVSGTYANGRGTMLGATMGNILHFELIIR